VGRLWNSTFDGANGTLVTNTVPLTGTFGVPQDALANDGALEVENGELRCRGSGATLIYLPLTGWTPGTAAQTIETDTRAGTIGGGAHAMSIIIRSKLPGDFYLYGLSQNGVFIDKYLNDLYSSTLYVNSTGIVAGTLYTLRFDAYLTGQNILRVNGTEVYNATDPSPITPDGQENWIVGDNTGAVGTPTRLSRLTIYDGIETVAALQDPAHITSRRYRGHPYRSLSYRGNGQATGNTVDAGWNASARSVCGFTVQLVQGVSHGGALRSPMNAAPGLAIPTSHTHATRLASSVTPAISQSASLSASVRLASDIVTALAQGITHGGAMRTPAGFTPALGLATSFDARTRLESAITVALRVDTGHSAITRLASDIAAALQLAVAAPDISRVRLVSEFITSDAPSDGETGFSVATTMRSGFTVALSLATELGVSLRAPVQVTPSLGIATAHGSSIQPLSSVTPALTQAAPWNGALTLRDALLTALRLDAAYGGAIRSPMALLTAFGIDANWQAMLRAESELSPSLRIATGYGGRLRTPMELLVTFGSAADPRWITSTLVLMPALTRETLLVPPVSTDLRLIPALTRQRIIVAAHDLETL
jgi:hypothetical protein